MLCNGGCFCVISHNRLSTDGTHLECEWLQNIVRDWADKISVQILPLPLCAPRHARSTASAPSRAAYILQNSESQQDLQRVWLYGDHGRGCADPPGARIDTGPGIELQLVTGCAPDQRQRLAGARSADLYPIRSIFLFVDRPCQVRNRRSKKLQETLFIATRSPAFG